MDRADTFVTRLALAGAAATLLAWGAEHLTAYKTGTPNPNTRVAAATRAAERYSSAPAQPAYAMPAKVTSTAPQPKSFAETLYPKLPRIPAEWRGTYKIDRLYDLNNLPNPKTTDPDFKGDDDITLLARLVFGEARGESVDVRKDIAYTVVNRAGGNQWWGHTAREVVLKPYQYSCFNRGDPNLPKLMDPFSYASRSTWSECLGVATCVLANPDKDTSKGATHYFVTCADEPEWARGQEPVKVVPTSTGHLNKFYRLER